MEVTLPADLRDQARQELASGPYRGTDDLIEQAIRRLLDESHRGQERLAALRRVGNAVDRAALLSEC